MNEKTEPEKEYPYIDRPMWLYSRSSDKKISALMQQMQELLEEAQRRSYTVVGTSQDMGTGRSMARMGLQHKEGHFAFRYKNFLGYRPGENGEPEIDPEQAAIVSRIFFAFLSGDTPEQIAKSLEADHIPSPTGKPTWSKTTIRNMLAK